MSNIAAVGPDLLRLVASARRLARGPGLILDGSFPDPFAPKSESGRLQDEGAMA